MKVEYDRCEEYWASKLEDEREVFAEEQRAGDERLAELARAIADYERQFAPSRPRALPPIDEGALELQVTELEDEFAKYRTEKEAEIASKVRLPLSQIYCNSTIEIFEVSNFRKTLLFLFYTPRSVNKCEASDSK